MSTTVTYKGETLTTVSNDTAVLETGGTWLEDDITLTDTTSGGTMQAKTNIDPTTSSQTITADQGYDGLSSVQINAMPTGTAGTPTATKGTVSNHSIAVTPSVTNTTGYITGSTINGTAVTVSASELDSGAKSITSNGNSQDVVGYASVDVAVPNSYSASDEGKVVSSGALVSQTSDTVTANDTYDTTLINSLTVNVSGGGGGEWTSDEIATNAQPNGAIVLGDTVTTIAANAFRAKAGITSVVGNSVTTVSSECFRDCSYITDARFPNLTSQLVAYAFTNCTRLATLDAGKCTQVNNNSVSSCTALRTLVLRRTSVCALQQWSSNGLGGIYSNPSSSTVYVPNSLISSYQTASNWSSAYAAGVTFAKIEGSIYE